MSVYVTIGVIILRILKRSAMHLHNKTTDNVKSQCVYRIANTLNINVNRDFPIYWRLLVITGEVPNTNVRESLSRGR